MRRFVPGDGNAGIAARARFLLSAFLFAFATMQTGLVRSDPQHLVLALYPMMFFIGVVSFSFPPRSCLGGSLASADRGVLFRNVWSAGGNIFSQRASGTGWRKCGIR